MKGKSFLILSLCFVFFTTLIMNGCSENFLSSPTEPVASIGIHVNDIQWAPVKADFIGKLKVLEKSTIAGKTIVASNGGTVGGEKTFNNWVTFPPNALSENTYVTVEVICEDNFVCVEFLPSGTFNDYVDITLSWEQLDVDEPTIADLNIYFSRDDGNYWFPIDSEPVINYDNKTVTFKTNHFTRYGWGI
ncbi:MAG: hypothetical protein J7L86_06080 [Candidatus Marinimicrobia bacterium]|nr:hypothetical protein [Candidatus Neomarinimicrobiota bacterium]